MDDPFLLGLIKVNGVCHLKLLFNFADRGVENFGRRGAIVSDEEDDQAGEFFSKGKVRRFLQSAEVGEPFFLAKPPAKF